MATQRSSWQPARSIEASCRQQAALYRWCQMLFSPNCAHLHRWAESLPDSLCCPSRIERRDLSRFMLHPVVQYISKFYLVVCLQFSMPHYHQHTAAMRTESRLLYTVTYSRLEPRSSLHDLEVHVIIVLEWYVAPKHTMCLSLCLMLEAGASPDHATSCGVSPLPVAAIFRHFDVRWQAFFFLVKCSWNRKLPL